jgi:HEAT repeat protein
LNAKDEMLQVSALKALAAIRDPTAIPPVREIAREDSSSFGVRATAAETLARLGERDGLRLLAATLRDADCPYPRSARRYAIRVLLELRGVEAIPDLEAAMPTAGSVGRWRLRRAIRKLRFAETP